MADDILIRPFDARKDLKEVQMLVGMSAMEQLAVANRIAYAHPLAISVWLVFASVIIQALHLWPTGSGSNGWLGYLAPLPTLACTAVPVMFAIDWLHRPHFEKMLRVRIKTLTTAISNTASKNRPLFLVMEYKKTPIGCILLQPCITDARPTYRIAHFHVDAPYRRTGVGFDLLSRAIKELENSKADVVGVTTQLTPYVAKCLREVGFKPDEGVVRIWDAEKGREIQDDDEKVDVEQEKVLLADTRRSGWKFSRV